MKILALIAALMLFSCTKPKEYENRAHIVASMATTMDKQFPGVPSFSKENLPPEAVLVDVRSSYEREISSLPGAISKEVFAVKMQNFKDKKVVGFDTLGKRSIAWVTNMRAQGFEAYNLHGGILAWAHAGGEFVNAQGMPSKKVHVYAEAWDMLPDSFEAITK